MQHSYIARTNAKVRYDQLVQESDDYRLIKQLPVNKPGFGSIINGLLQLLKTQTTRTASSKSAA